MLEVMVAAVPGLVILVAVLWLGVGVVVSPRGCLSWGSDCAKHRQWWGRGVIEHGAADKAVPGEPVPGMN